MTKQKDDKYTMKPQGMTTDFGAKVRDILYKRRVFSICGSLKKLEKEHPFTSKNSEGLGELLKIVEYLLKDGCYKKKDMKKLDEWAERMRTKQAA